MYDSRIRLGTIESCLVQGRAWGCSRCMQHNLPALSQASVTSAAAWTDTHCNTGHWIYTFMGLRTSNVSFPARYVPTCMSTAWSEGSRFPLCITAYLRPTSSSAASHPLLCVCMPSAVLCSGSMLLSPIAALRYVSYALHHHSPGNASVAWQTCLARCLLAMLTGAWSVSPVQRCMSSGELLRCHVMWDHI